MHWIAILTQVLIWHEFVCLTWTLLCTQHHIVPNVSEFSEWKKCALQITLMRIYGLFVNIVTRSIVQNCGYLLERPKSIRPCVIIESERRDEKTGKSHNCLFWNQIFLPEEMKAVSQLPILVNSRIVQKKLNPYRSRDICSSSCYYYQEPLFVTIAGRVSKHDNLISAWASSTSFFPVIMAEECWDLEIVGTLIRSTSFRVLRIGGWLSYHSGCKCW